MARLHHHAGQWKPPNATTRRHHARLTPLGIIRALRLCNPIYRATAAYGHFGRPSEKRRFVDKDVDKEVELFTWEQANRVEDLRLAVQRPKRSGSTKAIA